MVYRGTYKNGVVVLEGEVRLPEGQRVTVDAEPAASGVALKPSDQSDALLKIAGICDSGRPDGSVNHDHYIYGTPKHGAGS